MKLNSLLFSLSLFCAAHMSVAWSAELSLYAKAQAQVEKLNAGSVEEAELHYHIGMMLNNGNGGAKKDPQSALVWFRKAAENGNPLAQYKLGCYYAGQFGLLKDEAQALEWKMRAAQAGYSLAQHDVALIFYKRQDYTNTALWLRAAADQGEFAPMMQFALLHASKRLPDADSVLAYAYTKVAADLIAAKFNTLSVQREEDKKLISKLQGDIDKAAQELSAENRTKAEQLAAQWQAKASSVTLTAREGMKAVERLLN